MTNNKKLYRQEMIDAINIEIARKYLSFGCRIVSKHGENIFLAEKSCIEIFRKNLKTIDSIGKNESFIIIGHPVMIGDVLDWVYDNKIILFEDTGVSHIIDNIIKLWIGNLRKPIEQQSKECIEFIYNLIP